MGHVVTVSLTGVRSQTESGPATATMRRSRAAHPGDHLAVAEPQPHTHSISTAPDTPSTIRTRTGGWSPRGGMKSITRTTPLGVCHSVSRISVLSW